MPKSYNIKTKNNSFILNGKPFFLHSGEIHYFRIPKEKWPCHLKRAKEAGLNTVSSYIPWIWHEQEQGKFDFSGITHPQKDLVNFLKLVKKSGLYFLARVGPVSNAELTNEGIPSWLLANYPEVYVKGREVNRLPHKILISYLNPTFLKYTRKWYEKVLPVIKNHQINRGGNIVLLQLCNEIGMIHWLNKAPDYSRNTRKMYQGFLKKKYRRISFLNRAYKMSYKRFSQISQPDKKVNSEKMMRWWDWMEFYRYYYATYFRFLKKETEKQGIKIPLISNIPQFYDFDVRGRGIFSPLTTLNFSRFSSLCPDVVFGGAYQPRRVDYENFHDLIITTEMMKMVSSSNSPAILSELQSGVLRDRPRIYSKDIDLNLKTSIASGLNGVNYYMFSGGKNPDGLGAFGPYHEWQAPVSSDGQKRKHLKPIAEFGRFIKKYGRELSCEKKVSTTNLGFYPPYYSTIYLEGNSIKEIEEKRSQFFFDGLARLLLLAAYDFSMVDIQKCEMRPSVPRTSGSRENAKREIKTLWVWTLGFMDEKTQKKLSGYVKDGGNLVLCGEIPVKNLKSERCQLLLHDLGIKIKKRVSEKFVFLATKTANSVGGFSVANFSTPALGGIPDKIFVESEIAIIEGKGEVLARTQNNLPCGIIKSYGKGKVVVLGFHLVHNFDYYVGFVKKIGEAIEVKSHVKIEPEPARNATHSVAGGGIIAILRGKFLFLFNYHDEEVKAKVTFLKERKVKLHILFPPRSAKIIRLKQK